MLDSELQADFRYRQTVTGLNPSSLWIISAVSFEIQETGKMNWICVDCGLMTEIEFEELGCPWCWGIPDSFVL